MLFLKKEPEFKGSISCKVYLSGKEKDNGQRQLLEDVICNSIKKYPPRGRIGIDSENLEVFVELMEKKYKWSTLVVFGKYAYFYEPWYFPSRRRKVESNIVDELNKMSLPEDILVHVTIQRDLPLCIWDTSRCPWPF